MTKELVEQMAQLGFPRFALIGHDRGGRVSYRLALDHPQAMERLVVFAVIPILEAWNRTDALRKNLLVLDFAFAERPAARKLLAGRSKSFSIIIFLRNHDELTLEMVTEVERDYMYDEYARDTTMRINRGIRRRLAPLMNNDRRQRAAQRVVDVHARHSYRLLWRRNRYG
jgi:pimeloyl-ACP methyl ester carboxylesterase